MVFECFSAIAKAVQGRSLMSLEVPWDVLGVPGVALGSAAGRSWSTMRILVGSWSHLGDEFSIKNCLQMLLMFEALLETLIDTCLIDSR